MSNFSNLANQYQYKLIRIPGIQRDYAEGRLNTRVSDIRRTFLNELLKIIYVEGKLHLDFVYGYSRDDAFEPLDGQQRLTTLFLLYWYFCPKDNLGELQNNESKAFLSYATRQSSIDFCNELVKHASSDILDGLEKHNNTEENEKMSLSKFIKKYGWFKWQWRYDPTICSMLIVIEEITNLIKENKYPQPSEQQYNNLNNISFELLNLDELNMGDELYVKMNARGKLLSSFDIMKSVIEEEIQLQNLSGEDEEKNWRSNIDGKWITYFWQKYYSSQETDGLSNIDNITYTDVETNVEMKLKRLIQRMICLQMYNRQDVDDDLWMISKQADFDNALSNYCNIAWKNRTIEIKTDFPEKINFKQLICDINSLFYKDTDGWHNVSELLDIEWDKDKNIWDEYLGEPERDLQVAFFAMVAFLRIYPASEIYNDENKKNDFRAWMRFIRNIVILRNTNDRIDNIYKQKKAVSAIGSILEEYKKGSSIILETISNLKDKPGLENAALEEERIKANLKLFEDKEEWINEINNLEANEYLWGQLIAPLKWSLQEGKPNLAKFKEYSQKLKELFPLQNPNKFRAALLCISNYGNWKNSPNDLFLGEANFHRDRSIKRFLRSNDSNYAEVIRQLIDIWNNQFPSCPTFDDFFEKLKANRLPQIKDWRKFIILEPSILAFAINSKLWYDSKTEHMFLRQKLQSDTQHREIILAYLNETIKSTIKNKTSVIVKKEDQLKLKDWYPETDDSNTLSIDPDIHIGLANYGKYLFFYNSSQKELSSDELINELTTLKILP
jgi:hypothetical protein